MSADILIIDDEEDIRDLIADILSDEGYETRRAGDSDGALAEIVRRRPSLVVLDIWLQGSRLDGLQLLEEIKSRHPDVPVIIISGHGNIETAVKAIKKGAYDFIEKPFKSDRLILVVRRALEDALLRRELSELRRSTVQGFELIGSSSVMSALRQTIDRIAASESRVLITGAPGSGKELVARCLHARSRRNRGPFIVVPAATMDPERVEEALFGVEEGKGGTGSVGLFEQAHRGTLFIDEVADMPLQTQSRILRVLVDQNFRRVGGAENVQVDIRVVCATARDLQEEIANGRFREDLYHRLNVVPLHVPSLREHCEDVDELVEYFMDRLARANGRPPLSFSADALAALRSYEWPGNVRQLRNVVEQVLILSGSDGRSPVGISALPGEIADGAPKILKSESSVDFMAMQLREAREAFEKEYLKAQIGRFGGNISRTAAMIGMERSALHRKLKALGINSHERGAARD